MKIIKLITLLLALTLTGCMEEPNFSGNATFSYKKWWEHVRDFAKSPLPIIAVAVAIFGALWTLGEAAIQFVRADPRGWLSYVLTTSS